MFQSLSLSRTSGVLFAALVCLTLAFAPPAQAQLKFETTKHKMKGVTLKVVFFGDRITAGYGLESEYTLPNRVMARIAKRFREIDIDVVNAGVVKDTATSALRRLPSILAEKPHIVVVQLGVNDGRQGIDPSVTSSAMDQIINTLTYNDIYVLLVGTKAPPSKGIAYCSRFNTLFPELAKRYGVAYYPDVLNGVEGNWRMLQHDKLHPNPEGMDVIADNLALLLFKMIVRVLMT